MVVMNTTQSPTTGVKTASLPTINLLPTSGSPGTSIMIDCLNFTPYATVRSADILWDNIPCSGGFTDSVSSTGRFTTLLDLNPNTTSGTHIITVADSSGKKASATFIVVSQTTTTNSTAVPTTQAASLPTITLTPATGIAGSPIMVTGYNFTPGGTVKSGDVTWNGGPLTFSQTYDVDITGKVTFLLILSDNAIPGTYKLVMTDSSGKQASATFIVN